MIKNGKICCGLSFLKHFYKDFCSKLIYPVYTEVLYVSFKVLYVRVLSKIACGRWSRRFYVSG